MTHPGPLAAFVFVLWAVLLVALFSIRGRAR